MQFSIGVRRMRAYSFALAIASELECFRAPLEMLLIEANMAHRIGGNNSKPTLIFIIFQSFSLFTRYISICGVHGIQLRTQCST
jgi:hypothetical protein